MKFFLLSGGAAAALAFPVPALAQHAGHVDIRHNLSPRLLSILMRGTKCKPCRRRPRTIVSTGWPATKATAWRK